MSIDRRTAILAAIGATALAARAGAQIIPMPPQDGHTASAEIIELWPGGTPGGPTRPVVEKITERSPDPARLHDRSVTGIARPRMVVFRPARPNGAAVMITPGGGYSVVVIDKEGYELARWLNERGITAFVLFYRLPDEGWSDPANTPLADAQRAMRLIRHRAAGYGLDPARICALGFSAGGHLCADLAARFDAQVYAPVDAADRLSARPDGAAPIYPVIAMSAPSAHQGSRSKLLGANSSSEAERAHSPHLNIQATSPPCFLLHAEDDGAVPVENSLLLRSALVAKKVPVEMHLFPDGGHGFGLRLAKGKSVDNWPELFLAWGRYRRLFA